MWRKGYNIKWTEVEGFIILLGEYQGQTFSFAPIGDLKNINLLQNALEWIEDFFAKGKMPLLMKVVPSNALPYILKAAKSKLVVNEDRDNFDYVYNVEDLVQLKGRKYHSKKNHINRFMSQYNFQYSPLNSDLLQQCLELEKRWCNKKDCGDNQDLLAEQEAIREALTNYKSLSFRGGVITIAGRVEAFTLGEGINEDTAVIHIEKANPDINELYAVINQQFCENDLSEFKYVNREEDMGIEGLRRAKKSYHPVRLEKKYTISKE